LKIELIILARPDAVLAGSENGIGAAKFLVMPGSLGLGEGGRFVVLGAGWRS
jgi:hypothetical protein